MTEKPRLDRIKEYLPHLAPMYGVPPEDGRWLVDTIERSRAVLRLAVLEAYHESFHAGDLEWVQQATRLLRELDGAGASHGKG